MGHPTCKICGSKDYQITSVRVDEEKRHTLRHECFPDAEDPASVFLLRGETVKDCKDQWRALMLKQPHVRHINLSEENETEALLAKWEKKTGLKWADYARQMAEEGYTWQDVADDFGIDRNRIRNHSIRRGYRFNWTAKNSPRRPVKRTHYRHYTAFGVTETLPKLVELFGEPRGIRYGLVHKRITRKGNTMTLEEALTMPPKVMNRREVTV